MALKFTKANQQLLNNVNMLCDFEDWIRGGMTFTNIYHIEANNPEIEEKFDPEIPECSLVPVEAKNLYGHHLSRKLLKNGFEWLSEEELKTFDPMMIDPVELKGYFLVIDLEYPDSIHDDTADQPFVPNP